MNLFFLSLAIIFCGGLLSLVFWRQFALMKTIGVIGIAGGCLLGLFDAGSRLFRPGTDTAAFNYLKTFSGCHLRCLPVSRPLQLPLYG